MKKWQTAVTAICVVLLIYVSAYVALRLACPTKVRKLHTPEDLAFLIDVPKIKIAKHADINAILWDPPKFDRTPVQKIQHAADILFTPLRALDVKITGYYLELETIELSIDEFILRPTREIK